MFQHVCLHQHRWGGRQGAGTECLVGVTEVSRCPKQGPCFGQHGWLCLAGTRHLRAAQDMSDAGSCRAGAGQAMHAWKPARGAISVHGCAGRALQVLIASLSPTNRGKLTLPCACSAQFCSTREYQEAAGAATPIATSRSPHHLLAGPKATCRDISGRNFPRARQHQGLHPHIANRQLSILPSE